MIRKFSSVGLAIAILCTIVSVHCEQGAHQSRGRHDPVASQPWLEQLSWKPRAWLYHSFLTAEECDHLIDLARPSMVASSVIDSATGAPVLDSVRTSHGTFLQRYQDAIVTSIEDRLASWTQLPIENGEDLQILRYEHGQKYDEHWDWFEEDEMEKLNMTNGNRIATVLMYLTDVEEGGETSFSNSLWLDEKLQLKGSPSECARNKVFVNARKGDALLFFDLLADGQTGDKYSMHAGCPVIKGEKWSATKWIHSAEYGDSWALNSKHVEQSLSQIRCDDSNAQCAEWVKMGECIKNAAWMVGNSKILGACRRACGACLLCEPGDLICERKNVRLMKQV